MSHLNKKEREMVDEKIYKSDMYQLYITIDSKAKTLMASDYIAGEHYPTTCGRLSEVNSDLAEELVEYFGIDLQEYGVQKSSITPLMYKEGE